MSKVECISNQNYLASLEVGVEYERVADLVAEKRGRVRIIDESGESYLFPATMFKAVD